MTHEQLESEYQHELNKLRELAALRDYTDAGDKAFAIQRDNVYWSKCAIVLFESKNAV